MRFLLLAATLIALPAQAGIWPFTDRCDDIDKMISEGTMPSKEDAKFYLKECSGEKLESLGDAAAETASDASEKASELWQMLKDKASE